MRAFTKGVMSMLFGGLVVPAAQIVPASAETITLRVPVQLKEMVATGVKVDCEIYAGPVGTNLAKPFAATDNLFQIVNGEFDQTVELVLEPASPGGFSAATSYRCTIKVLPDYANTYVGTHATPEIGTPGSGAPTWKLARPDRFFRADVMGQLAGIPFAAPKGLKQTPQGPVTPPTAVKK